MSALTALAVVTVMVAIGCGGTVTYWQSKGTSAWCSANRDDVWPPNTGGVAWHPDGLTIFVSVSAPSAAIYRVSANGSDLERIVLTGPTDDDRVGPATSFSLSPAGWHLVYTSCAFETSSDLTDLPSFHRYAPELGRVSTEDLYDKRLTENAVLDGYPAWSPDGTRIAFLSDRRPSSHSHLHTMLVDGSEVQVLASVRSAAVAKYPPQWSPDGRRIAFVAVEGPRQHAIYTIAIGTRGANLRRLTEAVSGPSWSPDGQRLAFAKREGTELALYTIAADGTDAQRLTTIQGWRSWWPSAGYGNPDVSRAWVQTVTWSPDGLRIL